MTFCPRHAHMHGHFSVSDLKGLAKGANITSIADLKGLAKGANIEKMTNLANEAKALTDLKAQMEKHTPQDIKKLLADATSTINAAKGVLKK